LELLFTVAAAFACKAASLLSQTAISCDAAALRPFRSLALPQHHLSPSHQPPPPSSCVPAPRCSFEGPLRRLKAAIAGDPRYFQRLIATYLLRNPHRLTAHMYPNPALSAAREAAERARLAAAFGRMSDVEVQGVAATQAELLRRQQTPDDPAEVAKIPTLQLSDLPEHSKAIGREVRAVPLQGVTPLSEESVAAAEAAEAAAQAAAATTGVAAAPAGATPAAGMPRSGAAASTNTQGAAAAPSAAAAPAAFADGSSAAAYHGHSTAGSGTSLRAEIAIGTPAGSSAGTASAGGSTGSTAVGAAGAAAAAAPSSSTFTSLVHEQPTSGIAYASLHFDLSVLPQPLLPYLPLFCWALTSTGTARTDEVAMSHLLGTHTGGVGVGPSVLEVPGHREAALPFLVVSSKCLAEKSHRAASLVHDLLTGANLHRRDRITHYLRTSIAGYESGLVSSGHRFASQLLAAQYSKPGWIGEVLGGLTQLEACRAMLQRIESGAEGGFDRIAGDLESIRRAVLTRGNVLASLTGDATTLGRLEPAVASLVASLPQQQEASHQQQQQQQHSEGHGQGLLHRGRAGLARLASGWHWPGAGAGAEAAPSADHLSPAAHSAPAHGKEHRGLPHWPFTHLFGASASTVTASSGAALTAAGSGSAGTAPAPAGVLGLPDASAIPMRIGLVVPTQVCYVVKAAPAFAVQPARHAAWRLPHLPHMFPGAPAAAAPAADASTAGGHHNGGSSSGTDGGRKFVSGAAEVVGHLLRTGYLWERVRVQGGAYGAFCSVNRSSGVLGFASYRDPNLAQTLEAYDGTGAHLRAAYGSGSGSHTLAPKHAAQAGDADPAAFPASGHPVPPRIVYHHGEAQGQAQGTAAPAAAGGPAADAASFVGGGSSVRSAAPASAPVPPAAPAPPSEDVRKAILSTIGSLDAPQSPEERGDTSTARWLTGITAADVQARRAQVLGTGHTDIEEFAAAADLVAAEGRVVVVGSQAAFDAYHRTHRDQPMFALAHPLAKAAGARGAGAGGGGAGARSSAASAAWAAAAAEAGRRSKQQMFVMPRPAFLPPLK
jgi:hypothetical protein